MDKKEFVKEGRKDGKKENKIGERKELTWNWKLPVVAHSHSQLRRAAHQGFFIFPVSQYNYKVPCIFMLSII